jgi:pimeloyl-ACP methyl ester carboxylesterase
MASCICDMAQLIHQQELAPVSIVTHSLGGNIASRYAGIYPEAVRRLVMTEGLGWPPPMPTKETCSTLAPNLPQPGHFRETASSEALLISPSALWSPRPGRASRQPF